VEEFSRKFSIAPSGKTTDRTKKVRGMQKWDGSSLSPCMVEIVGRAPAVDEKVWCFFNFFVCLYTLWNDEVCDNGNAMKQCYFQNNYGVIACRKVCSCAHIFNFFCGPPKFSIRGKFIRKIAIFCDFWGGRPTLLKRERWNFVWGSEGADPGLPPQAEFYKKSLKEVYPFLASLYQILRFFLQFLWL